jgi:hypothetical protein
MHAGDLGAQRSVPLGACRPLRGVAPRGDVRVSGRRGDRQQTADRQGPVGRAVIVDERDHRFNGRPCSAWAKHAEAFLRISLACRSPRFSRSSALIRAASSACAAAPGATARSASRTHLLSASAVQPIFGAIGRIAAH